MSGILVTEIVRLVNSDSVCGYSYPLSKWYWSVIIDFYFSPVFDQINVFNGNTLNV